MDIRPIVALLFSTLCAFFYGWSSGLDTTGRAIQYVYYTNPHSWNEARNVCHSIGGELAKVDSQQTIDDIKQLALEKYPEENLLSNDFWIGLYDTPSERREFVIDCSELTFTSNYVEVYHDKELCFKLRAGNEWVGSSKPCSEDTPFLCEIHPEGTCSFRYDIQDVSAVVVSAVNDYGVCEDHCAYDVTCSGALYVSPSVCYKLPYNTSNTTAPALATISLKFCASFLKNVTTVTPFENRLKYPVDACGITPTNGSTVGNVSELSPSIYPTTSIALTSTSSVIAPSSSVMIEQPCSTLVITELVTSVVTAIASQSSVITEPCSQMTIIEPSATPCLFTVSPDISTVVLIQTATEVELTTVEVLQQCIPQTSTSPVTVHVTATPLCASTSPVTVHVTATPSCASTSPVTVHVTATPSCAAPVTPSITTPAPPNITQQEAEKVADEISKNLTVDVKTTSSYMRSLVCARDDRGTSQAVGAVGLLCIVVPLALVMASDLKGIFNFFRTICVKK